MERELQARRRWRAELARRRLQQQWWRQRLCPVSNMWVYDNWG